MPHSLKFRHILFLLATVALSLLLAGCGNGPPRSSATEKTGPGGLMVGQSRDAIEKANPGWTVVGTKPDGLDHVVSYRDYHWSLARGFAHSAEFHHVTYNLTDACIAWVSNSESVAP